MSRKFDESIEDKFEYQGELRSLVCPTSFPELVEALDIKGTLQEIINFATHEDDISNWELLMDQQNGYIQEYLDSISNFDNNVLVSNITYLTKSNGIRLGELERMLGVSAGYISRTVKENTSKKLSINVVWKMAKFFDVGIDDLVSRDFRTPSETADLLRQFIAKLSTQTMLDEIEWNCEGGYIDEINPILSNLPIFSSESDGTVIYHPEHMNQTFKWTLAGDIYSCNAIDKDQCLMIIPFQTEKYKRSYYDFIFYNNNQDGIYKTFHCNDPFSRLEEQVASLYNWILKKVDGIRLAPDVRSIIQNYLS